MSSGNLSRYEVFFLVAPEVTAEQISVLESQFGEVIRENKGKVLSFERWGKYRLAYSVRKNEYGIYLLFRFEIPKKTAEKILRNLRQLFVIKHNNVVMRHMFTVLDPDAPLEYKRPTSLEESSSYDVDKFLKENKMTGLAESASEKIEKRGQARKKEESVAAKSELVEQS